MSIEVNVDRLSSTQLDAPVATHVQTLISHCIILCTLTLHIIPEMESDDPDIYSSQMPIIFIEGATAKALRTLRPRLDRFTIILFGNFGTLYYLRRRIASDEHWVQGRKCYGWPELRLTDAQETAVSIKQRRYTYVGGEDFIHPHSYCIRVYHCSGSKAERGDESVDEGGRQISDL